MKKVIVRVKAFLIICKCKCQLSQLSRFIGTDFSKITPKRALKLYNLVYQLYWVPFKTEVEPTEDGCQGSFLLLEDLLYYLPNLLTFDMNDDYESAVNRFNNGYFTDTVTDLIPSYIHDLKYSLRKYNYETGE